MPCRRASAASRTGRRSCRITDTSGREPTISSPAATTPEAGPARLFHSPEFKLTTDECGALDKALGEAGFEFNSEIMFDFMREAIAGREYAKLVFTRNISDALELVAGWGIENGLNREELSFLTISQILQANTNWPRTSNLR